MDRHRAHRTCARAALTDTFYPPADIHTAAAEPPAPDTESPFSQTAATGIATPARTVIQPVAPL